MLFHPHRTLDQWTTDSITLTAVASNLKFYVIFVLIVGKSTWVVCFNSLLLLFSTRDCVQPLPYISCITCASFYNFSSSFLTSALFPFMNACFFLFRQVCFPWMKSELFLSGVYCTFKSSATHHSSSHTPSSGISVMEFVMSWGSAESNPDMERLTQQICCFSPKNKLTVAFIFVGSAGLYHKDKHETTTFFDGSVA